MVFTAVRWFIHLISHESNLGSESELQGPEREAWKFQVMPGSPIMLGEVL